MIPYTKEALRFPRLSKSTIKKMSLIMNNQLIVVDHVVEQSFIDGSIILDRDKR